jgi:hypothetical protein
MSIFDYRAIIMTDQAASEDRFWISGKSAPFWTNATRRMMTRGNGMANRTQQDGVVFLSTTAEFDIVTQTAVYPLTEGNHALADLRLG